MLSKNEGDAIASPKFETCITCAHYFLEDKYSSLALCARTARQWSERSVVDGELTSGLKHDSCKAERMGGMIVAVILRILTGRRPCGQMGRYWTARDSTKNVISITTRVRQKIAS